MHYVRATIIKIIITIINHILNNLTASFFHMATNILFTEPDLKILSYKMVTLK